MRSDLRRRSGRLATGLVAVAVLPGPGAGQELGGVVLEQGTDRGVAGALVRLVDTDDEVQTLSVSDSSGSYRLSTPGPGDYRITVEAYGYDPFRSHLLSVGDRARYAIDVELAPTPVPISGLRVSADRLEELEDDLRLVIGIHPKSLRFEPILRPEIEDHIDQAHGLTAMVRWSNLASVVTHETRDGPCFQWRNRQCLPVYLNGAEVSPEIIPVLPLEMIEMIVIVTPGESAAYGRGGVLMFTAGWIG